MAEYELVVVGAGPAGLAATAYAIQAQLNVALVAPDLGGKISYPFALRGLPAVDPVWGAQLVQQFRAQVDGKLKTHFTQSVEHITSRPGGSFQLTLKDKTEIGARTLILCTGAHPQRLHVPGETEFFGRGVSFSALSHAQLFRGRTVAVIGGERAVRAALKLTPLVKQLYYIVDRRKEIANLREKDKVLRHPKVLLFHDWEVQRIVGDEFVTGIELGAANGATRLLPVDGVFVEFGLLPNNDLVSDLVALDEEGHIVINQRCETTLPGLFAAGDVTNVHAEQVPVAIGEGVKAALSAWDFLATHR